MICEFSSLLPPDGDHHLRVQRRAVGACGVHLDLHVDDLHAATGHATALGARVVAEPGHVVLESPGGFGFCLVTERLGRRAEAASWSGGVRSLVDQVCLDVPPEHWDGEREFWQRLTGWEPRTSSMREFAGLVRPGDQPVRLLFQRLDDPQDRVSGHLDLSCSDRAAEVRRHVSLGAEAVEVRDLWTVLRPPAGAPYCVTDRDPVIGVTG